MSDGEQWSQRGRKPQEKETRERIHSGMKSFRKEKDRSPSARIFGVLSCCFKPLFSREGEHRSNFKQEKLKATEKIKDRGE